MTKVHKDHSRATRILLVDDHPMVRERLAELVQCEADLSICGEAEDCPRALELAEVTQPALAIVDLSLKNSSGLDLVRDLTLRHPSVRILVVSMHDESLYAERSIRAGAHGYITKQEATTKVLAAIRTVLNGGIYVSESLVSQFAAKLTGHRAGAHLSIDALTNRELQVFELLGQGHSTRDIAGLLRLDVRTIETYRARIKRKLQLRNASDLLQHAIRWAQTGGPTIAR